MRRESACERNVQCQKTDRRRRRVRCGGHSLAGARSWRRRRPPDDDQWQRGHARRGRPQQCAARRCRRPDTICRSCAPFFSGVYCIISRIIIYNIILSSVLCYYYYYYYPYSFIFFFYIFCFFFFARPPSRHHTPSYLPALITHIYAKYY